MQFRSLEDEAEFFAHTAGAEQEDHDEGVGEADFGAIDEAVADCLDEGERGMVAGVEDYALQGGLCLRVSWIG